MGDARAYTRDANGSLVMIVDHILRVVIMTFDRWSDQFKPQMNQLDKNASIDGCMFETFGKEVEFIRLQSDLNPLRVWTLYDNDSMGNGMHFVNRLGYFFSLEEADPNMEYVIYFRDNLEMTDGELASKIMEMMIDEAQAQKVIEIEEMGSEEHRNRRLNEILALSSGDIIECASALLMEEYEFSEEHQTFILKP